VLAAGTARIFKSDGATTRRRIWSYASPIRESLSVGLTVSLDQSGRYWSKGQSLDSHAAVPIFIAQLEVYSSSKSVPMATG